jgi:hypothetical protein
VTQPSLPIEAAPAKVVPTWQGKLADLMAPLSADARLSPGHWSARLLPRGALVAVKLREDGRRVVRIARQEKPPTKEAWERWRVELATFETHLGITGWMREGSPGPESGVAALYVELWAGETAPGKAKCLDCPAEIPFDRVFGGRDRCQQCAIAAGRSGP